MAPIPSGWVIASCVSGDLVMFTVDAAGVNSARAPVMVDDRDCGYSVLLAARPGSGPLLVWSAAYGVSGALIAADGQSAGKPFDVAEPMIGYGGNFDGAWVGDAFNLSLSVFVPPDYDRALRIARVDVNGTVTARDLLMREFDDMSRIARAATDTRVTYVARDEVRGPDIVWRRFGPAGELVADALLARGIYSDSHSPAVAFGDATLVLLADGSGSSLALTRVGRDGNIVTPRYDILRAPVYRIGNHDLVRRGPDAIVSWFSYRNGSSRVGLARITP